MGGPLDCPQCTPSPCPGDLVSLLPHPCCRIGLAEVAVQNRANQFLTSAFADLDATFTYSITSAFNGRGLWSQGGSYGPLAGDISTIDYIYSPVQNSWPMLLPIYMYADYNYYSNVSAPNSLGGDATLQKARHGEPRYPCPLPQRASTKKVGSPLPLTRPQAYFDWILSDEGQSWLPTFNLAPLPPNFRGQLRGQMLVQ